MPNSFSFFTLQEAADVYKRLLLEHRDFSALNIYLGLCYSKLDYFDVSSEILEGYLQHNPDSAAAINLKACNLFKLYTGKAAEAEIKVPRTIAGFNDTIFSCPSLVFPHMVLWGFKVGLREKLSVHLCIQGTLHSISITSLTCMLLP